MHDTHAPRRLEVRRYDAPTPGGYDESTFDPDSRVLWYRLGGAPHNKVGAAELWWDGDVRVGRYWLNGREVSKAAVHRLITEDDALFDAGFKAGWLAEIEAARTLLRDDDEPGFDRRIAEVRRLLIDDDAIYDEPAPAIDSLGRQEAAERLYREYGISIIDERDPLSAVDRAEAFVDERLTRIAAEGSGAR